MKESSETPNPHEIGETEKKAFKGKVRDLIRPDRYAKLPDGRVDRSTLMNTYKKDGKEVVVTMPAKKGGPDPTSEISAKVKVPVLNTDDGERILEVKEILLWPERKGVDIRYDEGHEVLDKSGKEVPPKSPQNGFDHMLKEAAYGRNIVTPDRYNDIMGTLSKLTPEDEVHDNPNA